MDKKVLFIVQNLPLPQDRRVYSEAKTLKDAGWDVWTISPGNADQKRSEYVDGIHIFRYPKPPKASGLFAYLLEYIYTFSYSLYLALKIYTKERYTVVHISNPPDFFFLIGGCLKLFGVKYVFDQHDLMPEMAVAKFKIQPGNLLYKVLLVLEKLALKICDLHIVTCQSALEITRSRHTFKAPTKIVQNAINYSLVFSDTQPKEQLLAVSRFAYICSYIGVMGPQDGGESLLKSIAHVTQTLGRKDIGFVLMGDGDDKERLVSLAQELGVKSNVVFTGWADSKSISTYLNVSDLGLMPEPSNPYTNNSLHNKVLEYMSAGLPFVSFDLKEARKAAGEAAVFVDENSALEFGNRIIELLADQPRRIAMGELGKRRVYELYNWQTSADKLLESYQLLSPRSAPGFDKPQN